MKFSVAASLADVDPAAWDALAGDNFPFARHAFLRLFETSKSVGPRTGWLPQYVLVHDGARLVGALPSYLKSDSYGEYVFDWAWAQAAARARLPYYPKIVVAIPFTPANGPRLFVHREAEVAPVRQVLLAGLKDLVRATESSGAHFLLCAPDEAEFLGAQHFIHRFTHQFHFTNAGYKTYDDFLAAMRSETRKQMRRERRRVSEQDIRIEVRRGEAISERDWQTVFELYMHTSGRKWGRPYLTGAFFEQARGVLGDLPLVALAYEGERAIAMSLSFLQGDTLFGRYWGAFEERDSLHFELCYHQLVDYAIAHGLRLVEAGAQGEHKFKRGFLPVITHSAHWLVHAPLADAVAHAVAADNADLQAAMPEVLSHSPFKAGA